MGEIINFIVNNFSIILSVLALIISFINLIYLFFTNRKKLNIEINNYTLMNIGESKNWYIFNVELINKSRLPVSINEINILDKGITYAIIKSPRLLSEKNNTRNREIIKHQEVHSSKFPINLGGLTSEQKFIVMYGPERFSDDKVKIIINTNRGKIKKNLVYKNLYLTATDFAKETSEYYD